MTATVNQNESKWRRGIRDKKDKKKIKGSIMEKKMMWRRKRKMMERERKRKRRQQSPSSSPALPLLSQIVVQVSNESKRGKKNKGRKNMFSTLQ